MKDAMVKVPLVLAPQFCESYRGQESCSRGISAVKLKLVDSIDYKMLEMLELWDIHQGELHTGRATYQVKREMCVACSQAAGAEPSNPFGSKVPGARDGATVFGICFADFQFCFSLLFPQYALIPPFRSGMFIWFQCVLEVCDLYFDFTVTYS